LECAAPLLAVASPRSLGSADICLALLAAAEEAEEAAADLTVLGAAVFLAAVWDESLALSAKLACVGLRVVGLGFRV